MININQKGGNCVIDYKDDKEDFEALISAIDILGFSKLEQDTIFKMLASVLHIGNIYFCKKQVRIYFLS
jgi:myosin-15